MDRARALERERLAFTFAFARGFQIAEETSRSCMSAMDEAWEEWATATDDGQDVAALSTSGREEGRGTIMLEIAAADEAHQMWERRWKALLQLYAIERYLVDRDGRWGLRDFLDYAGEACGFKHKGGES